MIICGVCESEKVVGFVEVESDGMYSGRSTMQEYRCKKHFKSRWEE